MVRFPLMRLDAVSLSPRLTKFHSTSDFHTRLFYMQKMHRCLKGPQKDADFFIEDTPRGYMMGADERKIMVHEPEKEACCCKHKASPRSDEFQEKLQKRLNRAIGQLNGIKGMIEDNRYCGDVLVQLAGAEAAIHQVSLMLLQDHMQTCVVEQIRQGDDEVVEEMVQLIKRFAK